MWRVLVVVVLGCHNDPKPAEPIAHTADPAHDPAIPDADPAPCDQVATNILKLSPADGDVKQMKVLIEGHCRNDVWSVQARRCIVTAASADDGMACVSKLNQDQIKLLGDDVDAHGSHFMWPKPTTNAPNPALNNR